MFSPQLHPSGFSIPLDSLAQLLMRDRLDKRHGPSLAKEAPRNLQEVVGEQHSYSCTDLPCLISGRELTKTLSSLHAAFEPAYVT